MIKNVLLDFIWCWKNYNGMSGMTVAEAADKINRGDCGLAAIAVSYVLTQKYGMQAEIYQNINHCWFSVDGVEYDTIEREGYSTPAAQEWNYLNEADESLKAQLLPFPKACEEWMPCDAFGGYLVKAFVERYGLTMPTELQHCIDNAAEYESPDAIPGLELKASLVRAIPLPDELQ